MSNSQSVTNVNDIVTTTNTVIQENLSKLNEKLSIIRNDIIDDQDDEYENFYNRINFYFSTIISELKLNFLESLKKSQKNETVLQKENQILKQRIESDEKDILNLIMENMLLKIENETLEEKNMINISHYVDASPEALSEKSNGSLERKMQTSQKAKKSRNKSNINITTTTEDLSFKTELRNNINLKIKKRMAQNAIPHNNNSSSSNIDIKKKSNLMNFLSHANVINKNTNYNSIQTINNIKSISPKGKKRAQTGHHQHYKSFNNENNILSGEKSMCNLPSYSLGKVKIGDSRMKTSLNDLGVSTNMNGKSYSKGKFIKIISSSTNKQKKPNSVSKKSITKGFSNKSSYNILAENSSGLSNDFEKYKSNLMSKIGFSNANSGSNNNTGFNYLCNHNIKGIMNIKMNINK